MKKDKIEVLKIEKKEPKKQKKRPFLNIFLIVLLTLIVVVSLGTWFVMKKLAEIKGADIKIQDFSVEAEASTKDSEIKNIAIFGIDTRTDTYEENTRTDSIIVVSLDPVKNKTILTSYARDTLVRIEGYKYNRVNAAYAFGGAELAVNTLNYNFDLNVSKYLVVNFFAVPKIVDAIGGVDIDIKQIEIKEMNKYIKEYNALVTKEKQVDLITTAGINHLNGGQALTYMRIRHVGNADFERMERQRRVLTTMMEKMKNLNYIEIFNLINENISYIRTNLTMSEIGGLGMQLLKNGTENIETRQMPESSLLTMGTYNNGSYIFANTLKKNVQNWYKAVYGIDHVTSSRVNAVSSYISQNISKKSVQQETVQPVTEVQEAVEENLEEQAVQTQQQE